MNLRLEREREVVCYTIQISLLIDFDVYLKKVDNWGGIVVCGIQETNYIC